MRGLARVHLVYITNGFSTDRSMVVAMLQFFFVFSGFISGVCFVFMVLYLCFFWSLGKARDCGISWYIFFNP